jgi:hypothetical protein
VRAVTGFIRDQGVGVTLTGGMDRRAKRVIALAGGSEETRHRFIGNEMRDAKNQLATKERVWEDVAAQAGDLLRQGYH